MSLLMFLLSFGMVLTMFATAIAIVIWALRSLLRWLREPESERQARKRKQWDGLHPNHLKRAGQ